MIRFLEILDELDQVVDKGGSWVDVVLSLCVQCESLLMPRSIADEVGWLFVDLIDGDDGHRWQLFPSQMDEAPSSHGVAPAAFGFDPSNSWSD